MEKIAEILGEIEVAKAHVADKTAELKVAKAALASLGHKLQAAVKDTK